MDLCHAPEDATPEDRFELLKAQVARHELRPADRLFLIRQAARIINDANLLAIEISRDTSDLDEEDRGAILGRADGLWEIWNRGADIIVSLIVSPEGEADLDMAAQALDMPESLA